MKKIYGEENRMKEAVSKEKTWSAEEVAVEFDMLDTVDPFVTVRRKCDGRLGSLEFTHEDPPVYFGWREDG